MIQIHIVFENFLNITNKYLKKDTKFPLLLTFLTFAHFTETLELE